MSTLDILACVIVLAIVFETVDKLIWLFFWR